MTGGHKAWPMDGCTYSQIIATHGLSSAELLDMADRVSNSKCMACIQGSLSGRKITWDLVKVLSIIQTQVERAVDCETLTMEGLQRVAGCGGHGKREEQFSRAINIA